MLGGEWNGPGSAEPCSVESQGVPLRSPIMDRRYQSLIGASGDGCYQESWIR